jgi:hypothetical protein
LAALLLLEAVERPPEDVERPLEPEEVERPLVEVFWPDVFFD